MNRATRRRHWPLTDEATFRQVYAPLYDSPLPEEVENMTDEHAPIQDSPFGPSRDADDAKWSWFQPKTPVAFVATLDRIVSVMNPKRGTAGDVAVFSDAVVLRDGDGKPLAMATELALSLGGDVGRMIGKADIGHILQVAMTGWKDIADKEFQGRTWRVHPATSAAARDYVAKKRQAFANDGGQPLVGNWSV